MKWVKRLLIGGVMFLLPLSVLMGAVNITARMPDFYQYEFNRNEIPNTLDLRVKNDELADFFSSFMFGETEGFDLVMLNEDTDREESVFPQAERAAMERFRTVLNIFSVVGAVFLLPVAAAYVYLIRKDSKELLRRGFLVSIPVLIFCAAVVAACLCIPETSSALRDFAVGGSFSEEGMLVSVFTREFVIHGALAAGVIASILYVIIGMFTWSMTRPYRMFRRERRERK